MGVVDKIKLIRAALTEHETYWDNQRSNMRRLNNVYANKFWSSESWPEDSIRVESPEGYAFVEGYVASLFSKAPAMSVESDITGEGDAEVTKEVVDRFLYNSFKQCEAATRQALIYTHSFIKIAPASSDSLLDRVTMRAVPPWEIIVDKDASSWEEQRFCGHIYYVSIPAARKRWGNRKYKGIPKEDYLQKSVLNGEDLPPEYLYIRVIEFCDLVEDRLYFWSAEYSNGEKLLDDVEIPIRTYDDNPLPTIAPLYFVRQPSIPLEGISSLERIYDAIKEKNIVRSFWANAIRRDTRQYLYLEERLDSEQIAKLTSGADGAMVGIEGTSLEGLIKEVPNTPISYNHDKYLSMVQSDLEKGAVMAPFTRGESSRGATATEIRALYAYSSSEVGRLARERDSMLEKIAEIYIRTIATLIDEEEPLTIIINGKPHLLSEKDLDGKFKFQTLDMASTPLADEMKQQQFISLLPIFEQLGISKDQIRAQFVHLFSDIIPSDWGEALEAQQEPAQSPLFNPTLPTEPEQRLGKDGLPEVNVEV